jgi:WD40 repeat protein
MSASANAHPAAAASSHAVSSANSPSGAAASAVRTVMTAHRSKAEAVMALAEGAQKTYNAAKNVSRFLPFVSGALDWLGDAANVVPGGKAIFKALKFICGVLKEALDHDDSCITFAQQIELITKTLLLTNSAFHEAAVQSYLERLAVELTEAQKTLKDAAQMGTLGNTAKLVVQSLMDDPGENGDSPKSTSLSRAWAKIWLPAETKSKIAAHEVKLRVLQQEVLPAMLGEIMKTMQDGLLDLAEHKLLTNSILARIQTALMELRKEGKLNDSAMWDTISLQVTKLVSMVGTLAVTMDARFVTQDRFAKDQLLATNRISDSITALQRSVTIGRTADQQQRETDMRATRYAEISRMLPPIIEYETRKNVLVRGFLPGTRARFITEIEAWIRYVPSASAGSESKSSPFRLALSERACWIVGEVGVGKSSLAARIMQLHPKSVLAAHFCLHTHTSTQKDPRSIVLQVFAQLFDSLPPFRELILELDARHGTFVQRMIEAARNGGISARLLWNELILFPLQNLAVVEQGCIERQQKLIIVIEALDECTTQGGEFALITELLQADETGNFFANLPPWIGMLLTSHHEESIRRTIETVTVKRIHMTRNSADNEDDICRYFDACLAHHKPAPVAEIPALIKLLLLKCNGLFLLAHFMMRFHGLDHPDVDAPLLNTLAERVQNSIVHDWVYPLSPTQVRGWPSGFDEQCTAYLLRAKQQMDKRRPQTGWNELQHLLGVLLVAYPPMTLGILSRLMPLAEVIVGAPSMHQSERLLRNVVELLQQVELLFPMDIMETDRIGGLPCADTKLRHPHRSVIDFLRKFTDQQPPMENDLLSLSTRRLHSFLAARCWSILVVAPAEPYQPDCTTIPPLPLLCVEQLRTALGLKGGEASMPNAKSDLDGARMRAQAVVPEIVYAIDNGPLHAEFGEDDLAQAAFLCHPQWMHMAGLLRQDDLSPLFSEVRLSNLTAPLLLSEHASSVRAPFWLCEKHVYKLWYAAHSHFRTGYSELSYQVNYPDPRSALEVLLHNTSVGSGAAGQSKWTSLKDWYCSRPWRSFVHTTWLNTLPAAGVPAVPVAPTSVPAPAAAVAKPCAQSVSSHRVAGFVNPSCCVVLLSCCKQHVCATEYDAFGRPVQDGHWLLVNGRGHVLAHYDRAVLIHSKTGQQDWLTLYESFSKPLSYRNRWAVSEQPCCAALLPDRNAGKNASIVVLGYKAGYITSWRLETVSFLILLSRLEWRPWIHWRAHDGDIHLVVVSQRRTDNHGILVATCDRPSAGSTAPSQWSACVWCIEGDKHRLLLQVAVAYPINVLQLTPDVQYLLIAGQTGMLHIYSIPSVPVAASSAPAAAPLPLSQSMALFAAANNVDAQDILCAAFSPDSKVFVYGTHTGALFVWQFDQLLDPANDNMPIRVVLECPIRQLRFSPDGRWLLADDLRDTEPDPEKEECCAISLIFSTVGLLQLPSRKLRWESVLHQKALDRQVVVVHAS